jgi:hypothetical protein
MRNCCLPLALLLLAAAPAQAATAASQADAAAATLPDDATLQAAGARIGTITIRTRQIFDLDDPHENRPLFRLANNLHLRTREGAVRAELLFRSGDVYQQRLLEETERNLRNVNYLREPQVRAVAWHDGLVDIDVETQDVWTLQVGPSFGRSGGKNDTSLEIQDNNVLGYGKTLLLGSSSGVDRNSRYLEWRDPNVWGSRWKDTLRWASNSDGHARALEVWQPFYALDVKHAGGVAIIDAAGIDTRYRLGSEYDSYRHAERRSDIYAGWSGGLHAGHSIRLIAGWHTARDEFDAVPATLALPTLGSLPADRSLAYPYLRLDWLSDKFQVTRNQDLIARTEDLRFGFNATLLAGVAARAFGADRGALVYEGTLTYGWQLTEQQQLFTSAAFSGRGEQGHATDQRTGMAAAWYWRTSRRTLMHVKVAGDTGHELDLDHYYLLGGDNGLRGYPLRYQLGSARAQLKIEERAYSNWTIWQLFSVGGAVFFDAGRTFGGNPIGAPNYGWLRDFGVGLRLGNDRSSLGNIIHIDLATPFNGENLSRLQVLVGTEATF